MRWPDPLSGAFLAALLAASAPVPARAQQALVPGPIMISDGRAAAAAKGGASTGVMIISNNGALPEHLLAVACPAAATVTLQAPPGTPPDQARAGLLLPPGSTTTLDPSGWHLALSDLRVPLTDGQVFACSVRLGSSGEQVVELTVTSIK